ncbi:glycosyltransferase family 69 protein [Stipitochalara longipes BDJ]|nr:glycosyltransferase family 69 protein [Stipitochalara longipes BDJ]
MAPTSRINYDPLPRTSSDIEDRPSSSSDEFKDKPLTSVRRHRRRGIVFALIRLGRRFLSRVCKPLYIFLFIILFLGWQVTFNVPYADSKAPKFVVNEKETVFIAANIIDEDLVRGAWGQTIVELVQAIGVERTFVSIYGGPTDALAELDERLEGIGLQKGNRRVVSEERVPVDVDAIGKTKLPSGSERVERISFLAEVRNMALRPLESSKGKWDKVLFINDVFFDVDGALRLLWGSDGEGENGRAETKAVCAADFIESWKYYDTFATRDTEGYSLGVPIFPWFANVGQAISRKDVLAGKDRVRVKSCWGGMVAFDGSYFQPSTAKAPSSSNVVSLPLKFRSEKEPFWDSSECCLIHADIMAASSPSSSSDHSEDEWDTGIYMNPFVRVSYSASTQRSIWLAKRFEALFSIPQALINKAAHMPRFNPRRAEIPGQVIQDRLWISSQSGKSEEEQVALAMAEFGSGLALMKDRGVERRGLVGELRDKEYWQKEGYYIPFNRTARRGGYCGVRQLLVLKEDRKEGEGNWDTLRGEIPPLDLD